jgi:hypothetical protein
LARLLVEGGKERVKKYSKSDAYFDASLLAKKEFMPVLKDNGELTLVSEVSDAKCIGPGYSEVVNELFEHGFVDEEQRDLYTEYDHERQRYPHEASSGATMKEMYCRLKMRRRFEAQLRSRGMEALSFAWDPDQGGLCGLQEMFQKHRYDATQVVREQLSLNQPVRFFFVRSALDAPSVDLPYVHNAPVNEGYLSEAATPQEFEERYGLPQRLTFKPRAEVTPQIIDKRDWWVGVYR